MKITIAMLIAVAVCLTAQAWTEAETNAVVRQLVSMTIPDCDNIEESAPAGWDESQSFDDAFPTFDSLFEMTVEPVEKDASQGWTIAEKKAAFDNYLATFPSLQDKGPFSSVGVEEAYVLYFCRDKDYTNALGCAKAVLAATNTPAVCKRAAADIFSKFADASDETLDYIQAVLTNANCLLDYNVRISFFDSSVERLNAALDRGSTNTARNASSTLLGVLNGDAAGRTLDAFLLRAYEDYGGSSNRLALACSTLSANPQNPVAFAYFTPITNMLLNAEQPLPVVEGL